MTFNYEDALRLKSMEMAQECCTDDNQPNEYCTRMTLDLFHCFHSQAYKIRYRACFAGTGSGKTAVWFR